MKKLRTGKRIAAQSSARRGERWSIRGSRESVRRRKTLSRLTREEDGARRVSTCENSANEKTARRGRCLRPGWPPLDDPTLLSRFLVLGRVSVVDGNQPLLAIDLSTRRERVPAHPHAGERLRSASSTRLSAVHGPRASGTISLCKSLDGIRGKSRKVGVERAVSPAVEEPRLL